MFYEEPSMKSILDGFFSKDRKTLEDVRAIFGFDKIKNGLPFHILQACTFKAMPTNGINYPYKISETTDDADITLSIENYIIALLTMNFKDSDLITIRFMYRSDNFPGIEVIHKTTTSRKVYRVNDLTPGEGIEEDLLIKIVNPLIDFYSKVLYKRYRYAIMDQ